MSESSGRKRINKIKRMKRGISALDSMDSPSVEPMKERDTWRGYREELDKLYKEEVSSEYLTGLLKNVSLSGEDIAVDGKGFRGKAERLLSAFSRPFARIFAFDLYRKLSAQQRFNSRTALLVQRLLDLNKKSNDILSNKIEQMEGKYDELIGEIVYKYLVNFTKDLVSRMDILYRKLDENFISHDVELEKFSVLLETLQKESSSIKDGFQDIRGILGAQRRAFEEIYSDISVSSENKSKISGESLGRLKDIDYVIFENRFRGSMDAIKNRQRKYVDLFSECNSVLDIACGRGEFLELLKEQGIMAEGIDINQEMVSICRQKGLSASIGDALEFLGRSISKFDGVFCSNLIEHLDYPYLKELVKRTASSLKDGGVIVFETINPECLSVFSSALYLDLTHIRPVHPLGLEALLEDYGFHNIRIIRTSPVDEDFKLNSIPLPDEKNEELSRSFRAVNSNFQKLNDLLFSYLEYAVAAVKTAK